MDECLRLLFLGDTEHVLNSRHGTLSIRRKKQTVFRDAFQINQLFKIRGNVSIKDFEDKYFRKY